MNLIQKIKSNFLDKQVQDYISSNNDHGFKKLISSTISSNPSLAYSVLKKNILTIHNDIKYENFFSKNIFWVNSFRDEECMVVNNFLKFYFSMEKISNYAFKNYQKEIEDFVFKYFKSDFTLNDLVLNSYIVQYLAAPNQDICIMSNNNSFFETDKKLFFTNNFMTRSYVYIIKNPYDLFREIKYHLNDSQSAIDSLINTDFFQHQNSENSFKIENFKKNWSTNVTSWTNHNVVSTYNGLVLRYEDLLSDPLQTLADLIVHISQSGFDIKLNYKTIELFLSENQIPDLKFDQEEISNQTLKILNRDLLKISQKFNYLK